MGRGGAIDGGLQNAGKASSDGAWRRDWWRFAKWVESVERWGVAARLGADCEMRGMWAICGRFGEIRSMHLTKFDASNKI